MPVLEAALDPMPGAEPEAPLLALGLFIPLEDCPDLPAWLLLPLVEPYRSWLWLDDDDEGVDCPDWLEAGAPCPVEICPLLYWLWLDSAWPVRFVDELCDCCPVCCCPCRWPDCELCDEVLGS